MKPTARRLRLPQRDSSSGNSHTETPTTTASSSVMSRRHSTSSAKLSNRQWRRRMDQRLHTLECTALAMMAQAIQQQSQALRESQAEREMWWRLQRRANREAQAEQQQREDDEAEAAAERERAERNDAEREAAAAADRREEEARQNARDERWHAMTITFAEGLAKLITAAVESRQLTAQ